MKEYKFEIAIAVFIALMIFLHFEALKTYRVEVTFCDSRPPIVIYVEQDSKPMLSNICTYKEAVPKYEGYLNVCSIKVLNP